MESMPYDVDLAVGDTLGREQNDHEALPSNSTLVFCIPIAIPRVNQQSV
jgi:hypothetical protein